ncbi:hypothetical protein LA080_004003 [Diaporthe eres]|nr:hypothetical protein LA080_004003 [Diaporthe eres]
MLFARDTIAAVLAPALSTTHVEAAIAIGTAAGFNGENPCNVRLANPLGNGNRYTLQGCGGSLWLDNDDGSFNSNCHDASANFACNVHRSFDCS